MAREPIILHLKTSTSSHRHRLLLLLHILDLRPYRRINREIIALDSVFGRDKDAFVIPRDSFVLTAPPHNTPQAQAAFNQGKYRASERYVCILPMLTTFLSFFQSTDGEVVSALEN